MDALHRFVTACGDGATAAALLAKYKRKLVSCTSRPVCLKCGTVLQALGFSPAKDGTEWGDKKMGSTEWGVSLKVRELFKAAGVDYEAVCSL